MFGNVNRHLLLLQALLWLSLTMVYNAQACTPTPSAFRFPKITEVSELSCFAAETLRAEDGVPTFATEGLGIDLNFTTCKNFCFDHGFIGKIIALTPTECHCNKYFKDVGERDLSKCDIQCPGDAQSPCGGVGYVSAYPAS